MELSEELLSDILGGEVKDFHLGRDTLYYTIDHGTCINMHELANICKKKALAKNFCLVSWMEATVCFCDVSIGKPFTDDMYCAAELTEPEAVLKAYAWALKQKRA